MLCQSYGDPHVRSWVGHTYDLMGVGVFPLVELGGVRVQSFHCPAISGWSSRVSSNVGVALQSGSDTVTILGESVKVNGVFATGSVGAVTLTISSWSRR